MLFTVNQCFDMCNKLIVAYLINEILRNANDFHFILSDNHLVTNNSFLTQFTIAINSIKQLIAAIF